MRIFTKSFLALALTIVCVGGGANSVKAEQVYKVVYSSYGSYPWTVMGYTPTWVGGILTDDGKNQEPAVTGWHQYFIADGIPTVAGNDYVVKALVRCNDYFDLAVDMGWGWDPGQSKNTSVHLTPTSDFVWVEWSYKGIGGTSCNLVAKPWSGNTKIEYKELAVYTADAEYIATFGDLHNVTPHMYAKNASESYGIAATPDAYGVYTIESVDDASADDWKTQFWIATPELNLPAGQKFYVEFDYKADHDANVKTQTHREENGNYVTYHCVGAADNDKENITFTTAWQSIKKEVEIESDMAGWRSIAFNLNCDKTANKYYFRNIVLKVPEVLDQKVDFSVGSAEWATYSSAYNVSLGSDKGYAAKAHATYVELIPVTEVPANKAVLIEGAGKHTFDVIASAAAIADNDLQISDGTAEGDGSTIYALGKKNDVVGFMKVKNGTKIPAGKAYLVIPPTVGALDFIGFADEDVTGVNEVKGQKKEGRSEYFNLAGQRVAQPTKGLYIVNGKKVIVK